MQASGPTGATICVSSWGSEGRLQRPDLFDDAGGGVPRHEGERKRLTAVRPHDVGADDAVRAPVAPFDENIRGMISLMSSYGVSSPKMQT